MYSFPVISTASSADLCLPGCCLGYKKGCYTWGVWLSRSSDCPAAGCARDLHTCSGWLSRPCWQPEEDLTTLESFKDSMA